MPASDSIQFSDSGAIAKRLTHLRKDKRFLLAVEWVKHTKTKSDQSEQAGRHFQYYIEQLRPFFYNPNTMGIIFQSALLTRLFFHTFGYEATS